MDGSAVRLSNGDSVRKRNNQGEDGRNYARIRNGVHIDRIGGRQHRVPFIRGRHSAKRQASIASFSGPICYLIVADPVTEQGKRTKPTHSTACRASALDCAGGIRWSYRFPSAWSRARREWSV